MKYLTFLLLLLSSQAFCQLDREYVDSWVNSCSIEPKLDSLDRIYVVDGVLYYSTEIKRVLSDYKTRNKLVFIDFIHSDSVENNLMEPNSLLVIVGSSPKLERKQRQKKLQQVQSKFKDNYLEQYNVHPNPRDPVLIVNNKLIAHENAKKIINELNPRHITNIQFVRHTSFALYGRNARNGAVTIITNEFSDDL